MVSQSLKCRKCPIDTVQNSAKSISSPLANLKAIKLTAGGRTMRKAFSLRLFIALFILVLGAFLSSCGSIGGGATTGGGTGSTGGTGGGGSVNPVSQIGGQIVNWDPNAGYTLHAYIGYNQNWGHYEQISVDSQGNFTYTLPTPNASDLYPISFSPSPGCTLESTPTVSPSDVKVAFLILRLMDSNNNYVGNVSLSTSQQPQLGTPIAGRYRYADRPFTISGTLIRKCTYNNPDGTTTIRTYTYNYYINAPAGWSYEELVFKSSSTSQQGNTIYENWEYDVVSQNSPSSNLSWMILLFPPI